MARSIGVGAYSCVVDSGVKGPGRPVLPVVKPGRFTMADLLRCAEAA